MQAILTETATVRPVSPDARFSDLGLASADMVTLMLAVEAEFDIMIPANEITLETFASVASVATLVERLHLRR